MITLLRSQSKISQHTMTQFQKVKVWQLFNIHLHTMYLNNGPSLYQLELDEGFQEKNKQTTTQSWRYDI